MNFADATANLTADFDYDDGDVITRLEAPNMSIDGYSFTGDEVNLYLDDGSGEVPVDLTGANSESGSAGLFFGPIDEGFGVPSAFGAVALKEGDDDAIWLSATGDAISSDKNVPPE